MIDDEKLAGMKALNERELHKTTELGRAIGFGNLMHLASLAWESEDDQRGSHFVVGPCASSTVACPHLLMVNTPGFVFDENGHCKWCCGTGWVTKAVWAHMNRHTRGPVCEVVKMPTGGDK
jgi:hypothetical protein